MARWKKNKILRDVILTPEMRHFTPTSYKSKAYNCDGVSKKKEDIIIKHLKKAV